jgi:cytochrome c-type biogenesis protein CcmH
MTEQQYGLASDAFAKAHALESDKIAISSQYANALFFANNQSMTKKISELINAILVKDPTDDTALNLLAVDAFHQKKYSIAIQYWEKILTKYDPNSPEGQALLSAIAKAQKLVLHQ